MHSKNTEEDVILTTSAAARMLGVATSTVQLWMESGAIASWKTPGGHRRTRRSTIQAMLDRAGPLSGSLSGESAPPVPSDPEFLLQGTEDYPVGPDEARRLALLAASGMVDSPQEIRFNRIVRLAATVTASPIALVSLLTARRQWFKARIGLEPQETPREWAFCSHAILQDAPFMVEDASTDERFRDNPLVLAEPHIRFYAGVPLRDRSGLPMGTLCVIDREPRRLRTAELQALCDLADIASSEFQSKRA
ncbi:GAF domain-containing protein [Massilia yuzhufengensis]|uniref:DNA binding domain-containing protein, excisionase family n=1 Tax=Massilia yuzhufengensis TaxID=1164594 RepID=A0A1I1QHZ6_9BURK|nr:GAF domain-containing protein [Massilia yuzhufengensis]SFD21741.1 DNA binding domain-containing protein, excisionase family [Massilia yuzhufengensis]